MDHPVCFKYENIEALWKLLLSSYAGFNKSLVRVRYISIQCPYLK